LGGEVLIQTSLPDHFAVRAALDHDFKAFATRELQEREDPPYPPSVRLANVLVSSPVAEEAAEEAERSAAWIRKALGRRPGRVELVGPAPAPIEKLHGRWRWHFLLRSLSPAALGGILMSYQEGHRPAGRDVRVVVDRDPVALL
jgi:primosomal protein N' (replication factor Y)